MTTFAQGASNRTAYVAETTYGVTPTTPTTIQIPVVDFGINHSAAQIQDNSIRPDGQQRYLLTGNVSVSGDFDVNLNHSNFDPFFASLLTGTWATNVLKFGSTVSSFTFEQGDLGITQFWSYTGVRFDKAAITINTTGPVTVKFSVIGKSAALSATTLCASPTAITEAPPFVHLGGTFTEGGSTTALISALTINIDRGLSGNYTLGSGTIENISSSMVNVTGSADVMFQDAVIANKYLNGTATTLTATLTDGTNTYEFTLPNVKYTGLTRTVTGQGVITMTVPFSVLYDGSSSTTMTVTRSS